MKRLPNSQQKLVIDDLNHNVILFASAGTGKTFTVANRIQSIIESGEASPEEILCVTFTVKACKEMADDISFFVGEKAKQVSIKTIHSFCLYLLKCEAKKNNKLYIDLDVCDEVDEQDILSRLIEEKVTQWRLEDFVQSRGIATSIDDLAQKNVIYDPVLHRMLWEVTIGGKPAFLSSYCEILKYDETLSRISVPEIQFRCPFCRKIIHGQTNTCPECEGDLRAFLTPIVTDLLRKAPTRLPNIASAIKHCRYENNLYSENNIADYTDAFNLLETAGKADRLFTFYDPMDRKEVFDQRLLSFFEKYGGRLMDEYDRFLQGSNLVDYDDIIISTARELKSKETSLYWQQRYKYVIVDEMQDTSRIEYEVMRHIFDGSRSMMCGDYFQTIYSWRGSVPESVLEDYIHRYNAKVYMFSENYRATQILAHASFGFLKNTYPDLVGKYCPSALDIHSPEIGTKIQAVSFNGSAGEAWFIYHMIRSDPPKNPSSLCIMARSNSYISSLATSFSKLEKRVKDGYIPRFFTVEKSASFYKTSAVKDILAFLRVVLNETDNASMDRLTKNYIGGIGKAAIEKIHASGDVGISMSSFLLQDTYSRGDCYATLIDACLAGDIIVYDTETTGLDLTHDQVIQIAAVRYSQDGTPKETFERIVIPTVEISQGARDTIPFDVDEVIRNRGVSAEIAFREFASFAEGAVLVGHNSIRFDAPLIARELNDLGLSPLSIRGEYDTLSLAKQFYPKLHNFKLATLCDSFHIVNEDAHNALGDVKATGDVLFHMLWNNILPTHEERFAILSKYQKRFLPFYSFLEEIKKDIYSDHACEAVSKIVDMCNLRTKYKTEASRLAVEDVLSLFQDSDSSLDFVRDFVGNAAFSGSQIDSLIRKLNQIPIITVHQSKGCEFDTVILAGCNSLNFPSFAAVKDGNEEEEKRVFYVAISRAKKRLILTCDVDYRRKYPITPSPYIDQIPSEYISCKEFIRGDNGTWQVAK